MLVFGDWWGINQEAAAPEDKELYTADTLHWNPQTLRKNVAFYEILMGFVIELSNHEGFVMVSVSV